jgi:hypothetical protein
MPEAGRSSTVAPNDQTQTGVGRGRLARTVRQVQDGYGLTLVLTILTIATLAATGVGTGGGLLAVALTGATLLFALNTSRARPRVMRTAQILVAVSIAASALAIFTGDTHASEVAVGTIGFAIAAVVPVVILRRIAQSEEITYRLVIGALVVYLLLGLCYAYVFGLITLLTGQPFFVQTAAPTSANYLYFSYTTLSTVGYGDFSAATTLGQMTAISEALFGQLYLVSIVAILVANIGRSFRAVKDE